MLIVLDEEPGLPYDANEAAAASSGVLLEQAGTLHLMPRIQFTGRRVTHTAQLEQLAAALKHVIDSRSST